MRAEILALNNKNSSEGKIANTTLENFIFVCMACILLPFLNKLFGGSDETRTRDLCRDRAAL